MLCVLLHFWMKATKANFLMYQCYLPKTPSYLLKTYKTYRIHTTISTVFYSIIHHLILFLAALLFAVYILKLGQQVTTTVEDHSGSKTEGWCWLKPKLEQINNSNWMLPFFFFLVQQNWTLCWKHHFKKMTIWAD